MPYRRIAIFPYHRIVSQKKIAVYFLRQEYEGIISEQRIWFFQGYFIRQEVTLLLT